MTFRARLTLAYLLLLMLALTAFGFGVYTFVDRRLHEEFGNSVQGQGQALSRLLYTYEFAHDLNQSGQLGVKPPDQRPGTWTQILSGESKNRSTWEIDSKSPSTLENSGVRLPRVAYNHVTLVSASDNDLHVPLAVYSEPFEAYETIPPSEKGQRASLPSSDVRRDKPNAVFGEVTVARSLDSVESSLRLLRSILVGGGLAVLLVAALIGSGLAATLLRPLARMRTAAQQIGDERDFTRRMPVEGNPHNPRDELGRLSLTFNQMLRELERSHLDLQTTLDSQRRFVADASHELRTPLTAIRTNVEFLSRVPDARPEDRGAALDDVLTEMHRMESLVGDLLALARLEAAGRTTPRRVFRLDHLLADIHRDAVRHASDGLVEVRLGPLPEVWVTGDRDDLRRALWNLADNALKYTPAGSVELGLAARDGMAAVTVADTGIGIDAEHLGRLFDRFWRAPAVRGMAGSGLGLAIVKWVAELHGGSVSIQSQLGRGSVVTLELPVTVRQGLARRLQRQVEQIGRLIPAGRA
jgi:signal transduction histidine kinase